MSRRRRRGRGRRRRASVLTDDGQGRKLADDLISKGIDEVKAKLN